MLRSSSLASLASVATLAASVVAQAGPPPTVHEKGWCWTPPRAVEPPAVDDPRVAREPIDRFVRARLAAEGLAPAPPAAPATWLRRVSFDLCGLPPAPDELAAFAADPSPAARAAVVDRLLASPAYGEHMARRWMDLVRYAESMGHEFDYPILGAWRYRDWLIDAFDRDLPYDRFVVEQLAGDLLDDPRRDPVTGIPLAPIGTTGLLLNEEKHSPIDLAQAASDRIDNRIDVASKAFLGLTLACARCHDHKFDPIPTTDYYAVFGLLASARAVTRVLEPANSRVAHDALARADRALREAAGIAPPAPAGDGTTPLSLRDGDRVVADAAHRDADAWHRDGSALENARVRDACAVVDAGDGTARLLPFPGAVVHSGLREAREVGTLATASFTIDRRWLHVRAAGRGARVNVVVDGFRAIRAPIWGSLRQELASDAPVWLRVDLERAQGRRAHIEFCDLTAPDPADPLHEDAWDPRGWFALSCAVLSAREEPPPLAEAPAEARVVAGEAIAAALAARDRAAAALPLPVFVTTLAEGDPVDEAVHVRGKHLELGEVVPHRDLTALGGAPLDGLGSGRLAFARRIASAEHPLTARVMVNRVWQQMFGRGLVASADNFGELGDEPSHGELLDWLALRFLADGWSVKALLRRIALSETYALASRHDDPAAAATAERIDPQDVLLSRARVRRLPGEAIRDAMLVVSGRIDRTRFGPSVPVHLRAFDAARGRPAQSGPLDGDGRRSVYLQVLRNHLDPFFLAFDAPIPATTVGTRSTSNVPAQALALLNDPFAIEQAALFARRVTAELGTDVPRGVDAMYRAAFARTPSTTELTAARGYLGDAPDAARWAAFAHVLFNVKDFVFLE
ncbi:MAG: DUF1553 domain-containing protein [Planctomycetes bacterium]|nr:DUF1553 domain-containing protein [Planctomycetota bacterium]